MPISKGDALPDATLVEMGAEGPQQVKISDKTKGRKVVIFAVPGAFTPTCHSAHVPSFIRTKEQFDAKGVDEIICVSCNDPFVMKAWGESIGMDFDAPPAGLVARSKRYAMLVEDGKVTLLQEEENPGVCEVSGGEGLLASM